MSRYGSILGVQEEVKRPENGVDTVVEAVPFQIDLSNNPDTDPCDPNPTGPNAKTWQHLLYVSFHFQLYNDPIAIKDNSKNKNIYPLLKSLRTAGADVIVTNSELGYKLLPGKIPQREWDAEIKVNWLKPNHENLLECLRQAKRVAEIKLLTGGGVDRPDLVSEAEAAFAGPDVGPRGTAGATGSGAGGNGAEKRRLVFGVDSTKAGKK